MAFVLPMVRSRLQDGLKVFHEYLNASLLSWMWPKTEAGTAEQVLLPSLPGGGYWTLWSKRSSLSSAFHPGINTFHLEIHDFPRRLAPWVCAHVTNVTGQAELPGTCVKFRQSNKAFQISPSNCIFLYFLKKHMLAGRLLSPAESC